VTVWGNKFHPKERVWSLDDSFDFWGIEQEFPGNFGRKRLHFDNRILMSIPCWHLGLGGVTQGRTQIHELSRSSQYTSTLPEANITPEA